MSEGGEYSEMNKNEKKAFMNMMHMLSDYPKFVMMEEFLKGSALTAKSFTMDSVKLPSRAVYENLRQWRKEGILDTDEHPGTNGSYEYKLNAEALLEKLS